MKIATLDSDHKIQLPPECVEELGLHGFAAMENGADRIVIRRCANLTWDEVFADKLRIGTPVAAPDLSEVSDDDYLF
ncbi:MAG: hypothetical protein ABI614_12515 [Planctomycetota bacterium]